MSRVKDDDTVRQLQVSVKDQSTTHSNDDDKTLTNDEPADVEMQLLEDDDKGMATPGSLPNLQTVSSTSSDEDNRPEESEKVEPGKISQSRGLEAPKEVCTKTTLSREEAAQFTIWEEQISHLSLHLEEGAWWSNC